MKERLPVGFMSLDTYRNIIDQASGSVMDINLFMRGESLLHKGLPEMIRYAKSRGLRIRLETNATLLDRAKAEEIIRSGLDFISFSFDGYTKSAYEKIRKGGEYEKTRSNILGFLDAKKEIGSRKPYTLIQVIETEASASNKRQRADFTMRFKGLPISDFRIIKPHRFGGKIDQDITGSDYAYSGEVKSSFLKVKYLPCPYLWFTLTILWDGTIVPCCVNFFEEYPLGNIKDISLSDAWNSEKMRSLRKKIRDKEYKSVAMCAECDFLWQKTFLGVSVKNIRDIKTFIKEIRLN